MIINNPTYRKIHRLRKGAALVGVISVIMITGVVGVSMVSLTETSDRSHFTANAGSRAYFLAESGLRYAQSEHSKQEWPHGRQRTLTLTGGETVDVIRDAETFWATSRVSEGTALEAASRLSMQVSFPEGHDPFGPGDPNITFVTPESTKADDFAIFGQNHFMLEDNLALNGSIAMIDADIELRSDVIGDVLGRYIVLRNGVVEVIGNLISNDSVFVQSGTVTGDIHAEKDVRAIDSRVFVDGWIFSHGSVTVDNRARVSGSIHGGNITIGSGAVIGSPDNPVEIRSSGNVVISNNRPVIYGNVYAAGTITGASWIQGKAYAGGKIDNSSTVTEDKFPMSPSFLQAPIAPDLAILDELALPEPALFTTGSSNISTPQNGLGVVDPGSYRSLTTPQNGNASFELRTGEDDHGVYIFDSVTIGNSMSLYLDLRGTHDIRVFVKQDVKVGRDLKTYIRTDDHGYKLLAEVDPEVAKRVYWETHNNFNLETGSWFGTVHGPFGRLQVRPHSKLTGSYIFGNNHDIDGGTIVDHQPSNYISGQ